MKTTRRRLEVAGFTLLDQCYSPGSTLPWHCHTTAEFCFLACGSFIEVVGRGTFRYARHAVSFKPAGEKHRVEVPRDGARCLVIDISADRLAQLEGLGPGLLGPAFYPGGALVSLCARAFRELQSADEVTPLVLEGLALEILAHAARGGAPAADLPARTPEWLDRVRRRLHDERSRRPSLTELAQLAGVEPSHLSRTFHRLYHCTIGEYLRRLRLARARELLAAGDRPLAQVARECGFYDQSHFTRVFGKDAGVTPGRFQRPCRPETGPPDRA